MLIRYPENEGLHEQADACEMMMLKEYIGMEPQT